MVILGSYFWPQIYDERSMTKNHSHFTEKIPMLSGLFILWGCILFWENTLNLNYLCLVLYPLLSFFGTWKKRNWISNNINKTTHLTLGLLELGKFLKLKANGGKTLSCTCLYPFRNFKRITVVTIHKLV